MTVKPFRLNNGLTVVSEPQPQAQTVSFSLQLPLGAAHDPPGRSGLAGVTQELLFKGAGPWDARGLAREIDRLGLQESHRTERELLVFSGTVLPRHLPAALRLLGTLLREPRLPAAGLEEVRRLALHHLHALEDAPASKVFYELGRRFFPRPLCNPAEGTLADLPRITLADVQSAWGRYGPQGAILSLAGHVRPDEAAAHVEAVFGDWQGPEPPALAPEPLPRAVTHVDKDSEQTQIGLAYDSVPYANPDYLKARLGLLALSGGMSARLMVEIRQKRGLAYSAFATHVTTRSYGGVLAYAGTTAARAQETLEVLLAELERLRAGITAEELAKAKTRLKTDLIVQGESTWARAEALGRELFYRGRTRTLDEALAQIDALTLEAVNAYLADAKLRGLAGLTLGPAPLRWPARLLREPLA